MADSLVGVVVDAGPHRTSPVATPRRMRVDDVGVSVADVPVGWVIGGDGLVHRTMGE